jgi:hypothetical protein
MTAQIHGPTTVADILGREVKDERSLSLTTAPAYVISQDYSAGVQYAVVLGTVLGRRGLMDLLFTLAPYKAHGPDRFARVVDNWGLHDRAMSSSASQSLLLEHARSLKFSWREFARHRRLFMGVLQDQSENRGVTPAVIWSKRKDGKRGWDFEAGDGSPLRAGEELMPSLVGSAMADRTRLDSLVGLVTIPYFLPEVQRNWRAWQPLARGGKSNYIGPASVPVVALMHRRSILNSAFTGCTEAYVRRSAASNRHPELESAD